ncbi:hypothetical protein LCGC14_0403620 [marine sediment metagenome]|uniref:HTH cro/C1-type domain-containing protein n=1 Tax=marine sediment metagenome TaxID=412755 RepID=A0A0F9T1T1_9ZZZZ
MAKLRIGRKTTVEYAVEGVNLTRARGNMSQEELSRYVPLLGKQQNVSRIESQRLPHAIDKPTLRELMAEFEIEFYDM